MDRAMIERICNDAQLRPETKAKHRGYTILVADGWSEPPHFRFQRFNWEPTAFPAGCHVAMWFIMKDEKFLAGSGLPFEPGHDPKLSGAAKKNARVNSALKNARETIDAMYQHSVKGRVLNG